MKTYFFRLCYLAFFTLFLTACTRTAHDKLPPKTETIRAFFIADNALYAVGELYSYQFEADEMQYNNVEKLIRFLQSKEMKAFKSAEIKSIHWFRDENQVSADLMITLNAQKLKPKQLEALKKNYDAKQTASNIQIQTKIINGRVINLENKAEVLVKGKLTPPLKTTLTEYRAKEEIDGDWTTMMILSPVIIPILIITSPFNFNEQ